MKPHYPILDGLRGTAAILVVIFHLFEAYYPVLSVHPMHHGYLAVDFFYLLSGFVIGYAYDDRWHTMSIIDFFKIRLVRLHPLVILSILLGLAGFLLDPYTPDTKGFHTVSVLKLMGVTALSFTLLPSPDIRGWGETHSLNGPAWSLFQEYIANLIYAVWGHKMSRTVLLIIVVISGIALTAAAMWHGDVGTGWSYETLWFGVTRMVFPFFAGILLFRTGRLIKIPIAYTVCSLSMIILFFLPTFHNSSLNGLYEAVCIIVIFPLIVSAGAGGKIQGRWAKLCKFSGDISYPLYIIHYPFVYVYTAWVAVKKPAPEQIIVVASALFICLVIIAYASLKWYDEPVRTWLKNKLLVRKETKA